MDSTLPDHRRSVMIEGVGHWTQQERPAEFTAALVAMLAEIDPPSRRRELPREPS
jgi:pimeloyl-ACP methyl ester carboxylesterase